MRKKNIPLLYLLRGVGFGALFPLIAIIADCFVFNDVDPSPMGVINQILNNPIHFVILSAPIILGGMFYVVGFLIDKQRKLNKRLRETNKAMNETNKLLDTFNYHVSHDLKTVLNNQLVLTRMANKYVEKEDYEKLKEITEKMRVTGENGLNTVANFLQMSKEGYFQNANRSTIQFEAEIERILREGGCEEKVTVRYLEKEFETLSMQPKVFESIFINLITNSIKYTEKKPEIRFSLKKKNNGKLIVYQDNGIGIDLEKHEDRVFKPFQRIQNETRQEGTGVGLFIVDKMIRAYSGKIAIQSEPGKGVRFDIFFPDISEN